MKRTPDFRTLISRIGRITLAASLAVCGSAELWGGTFGRVVPIGGAASDIALDEGRGVLYIANFGANRIEVMNLADLSIPRSINVNPQPGSISLSPDGQFLLVAHFGNFEVPLPSNNGLTVLNLNTNSRQTFGLGSAPLGVAFGIDGLALVVTTTDFLLLDPVSGAIRVLDTIAGVTAKTLPAPPANFPPQIITTSIGVSGDGLRIFGLTDTIRFEYNVQRKEVTSRGYVSTPAQGPRVVSVNKDGSYYLAGWALHDSSRGFLYNQFGNALGALNIGSHAFDSVRNVVWAQVPSAAATGSTTTAPPTLTMHDSDNLAALERFQLAENLGGRSLLSSDGQTMYSVSDSGVTVFPLGSMNQQRRVAAVQESVVFRGNFCDRRVNTQEVTIVDPGGGNTDFRLTSTISGVTLSPSSGVTPARVRISVDPSFFQNQKGTVTGAVQIRSSLAVNLANDIRLAVNTRDPDQRGTFVDIPGKLVDVLADPARDRFYVLRQDKNQVLVFDASNYTQIATLGTGNTPTSLAVTMDRKWLLIGADNAQFIYVYDLDSLERSMPITMPAGHYPRSIAVSGRAILAASRVAGPVHMISTVDVVSRTASVLPSLGPYKNDVNIDTVLAAAPNGGTVMGAMADGTLILYDANADTFTVSRKDFSKLGGSYAASNTGMYVVDNNLLNASLVPVKQLEITSGASLGFAFVDDIGVRATAPSASAPGVVQKVNLATGGGLRPTRIVEAPRGNEPGFSFIRSLQPLMNRQAFIALTQTGFTVLAINYDAAVAIPRLGQVVNAADQTRPVAPGGLISVRGSDLSPINIATREIPLPTALGESCLTVNGQVIPLLFVSSSQINAQLPFTVDGNATMVLRTPGGVSDNLNFFVQPTAPAVFRSGTAGEDTGIPLVVRAQNNTIVTLANPVHKGDDLTIYATGLGRTSPAIDAGIPAPADDPALALVPPTVLLDGAELAVGYAGLAPGQIGVYQINVKVPHGVSQGLQIPLVIKQGAGETALAVRVVE
ncbi:MAG: hypothetical protein HYR60_31155 [Acidobacteria bacterium]|nr:hypothetical protein [Acidobacteriota bacterium]